MSKIIASAAIRGAYKIVKQTVDKYKEALDKFGPEQKVAFPNTAYYLPIIYGMLGVPISKLAHMKPVIEKCERLLPQLVSEKVALPYLGPALDAGMATLFAEEMFEAIRYLENPDYYVRGEEVSGDNIWLGAADDIVFRKRGIEFVDGTAPGFAAIVGAAPNPEIAANIARELQEKNLYVFMIGHTNGKTFSEQLVEAGVQIGWPTRLVSFGPDTSAAVFALGFATRVAMSFGGVKPGEFRKNLIYNKNRVFAFVLPMGHVTEEWYANAAGAINWGFPVIADTPIPEIRPTGVCTYEHVVSDVPHDELVSRALEVRGCKIKITKIPIPVSYGVAFSGERVRKGEFQVEFGGNRTEAFELLTSLPMDEVEDGKITVVGKEADEVEEGKSLPLAAWAEVAGRKMKPDYEPVLERQIHHFINSAESIFHMGQRDIVWLRLGKKAFKKGFRIKHLGEIIRAKLLSDYGQIVDKVQVTLFTDPEEVKERQKKARQIYRKRDHRLASMTDENVEKFYSCTLCQSFAPNHVCIVTPERLGLCGAYNWTDAKTSFELDSSGPNQPIDKGELLNESKGLWKGINDYVYKSSHHHLEEVSIYSLMEAPMTSCGCFEAIVAIVPECNGVMIVNREYPGMTPIGMTFTELAGMVGGGIQTQGFLGVGKAYISSKKFISGDGGIKRIVWMPEELKRFIEPDFRKLSEEMGVPDLLDKIADESVTVDAGELVEHCEKNKHYALEMEPMF